MPIDTIVVFTARSPERIKREGGSQAWVLNPVHARNAKWLVATQNLHNKDHEFSDATEPHGSAFLIGRISGLKRSADEPGDRWLIEIDEYARINIPNAWKWRNPVKYTTVADLGIDPKRLTFQKVHKRTEEPATLQTESAMQWPPATLTIAEAKKALAATFGVKPEAVEISIRG
jgi:hypothetical protein